jgi:DNA-binding transcriptional LysR family regulator
MATWRATPGRVPELRRLRYFVAVAGEQSFTRAAELLRVAQPALRRQVRLLERELGVELLHRGTRTFALTEAGRYLFERGPVLLDAADELWRLTSAFGAGERGTVAFGYEASAGFETVPELMRALTVRLPDLEITTQVMSADEILTSVRDGTLDVGAVRWPPDDPGLEARPLRLEPRGVQPRRDDPRAGGGHLGPEDIAAPPAQLETRLLARAHGASPAARRLLAVAEEVADELGWRGGPAVDAARR